MLPHLFRRFLFPALRFSIDCVARCVGDLVLSFGASDLAKHGSSQVIMQLTLEQDMS